MLFYSYYYSHAVSAPFPVESPWLKVFIDLSRALFRLPRQPHLVYIAFLHNSKGTWEFLLPFPHLLTLLLPIAPLFPSYDPCLDVLAPVP